MRMLPAMCAVLLLTLTAPLRIHAQNDSGNPAHRIFELTNQDRVARGLPPLHWNESLASAAQSHAQWMVAEGELSHQYPGEADLMTRASHAGAHFQAVAENIATGWSAEAIETEWMHSPSHRTNILDPHMNDIGVGVVERHGTLYAVEDFDDASQQFSSPEIERKVGALLRAEDIDPSVPPSAAQLACSANGGYPAGETGRLVIRFDTPDLTQLPGGVTAQIHSGNYRRASVVACSSGGTQGSFTTYRVAIVLY